MLASINDAMFANLTNFAVVGAINVEASLFGRAEDSGHGLGCHGGHFGEMNVYRFVGVGSNW